MLPALDHAPRPQPVGLCNATSEPALVRWSIITICLAFLGLFLVLPLIAVVTEALQGGWGAYVAAIREPDALAAIRLTLLTAAIAVPLNLGFGITAAWAIAKFEFLGRNVLITFIDLPFAISPVVSGLIYVLVFGLNGWLGPWLEAHGIEIIFAVPGIVLATVFVTFPFVARELIPLMKSQGTDEEEASLVLGASGWQTLWHVTLPNVKWGLVYGVIVLNARAMGEFGAVSVVSGHIRGLTNTIPLHVEILYNEYQSAAAFAVASLLVALALLTLLAKTIVDRKHARLLTVTTAYGAVKEARPEPSRRLGVRAALEGLFVRGRSVDRRNRHAPQPQVDPELGAVVDQMVHDGLPVHDPPRLSHELPLAHLQRPRHLQ